MRYENNNGTSTGTCSVPGTICILYRRVRIVDAHERKTVNVRRWTRTVHAQGSTADLRPCSMYVIHVVEAGMLRNGTNTDSNNKPSRTYRLRRIPVLYRKVRQVIYSTLTNHICLL